MAFVSEDRKGSGLVLGQSIRKNMTLPALVAGKKNMTRGSRVTSLINEAEENQSAAHWARELRVKSANLDQPVGELSGGNQQKVVLAKWLLTEPEILFLDEPTRGIDVGAKVEIYNWIQRLASQGIGIIVASSEMPELLGLCHRILVLREGHASGEFHAGKVSQEDIMRAASL
jgi:ABC-type sugar transport system ATPase subunit